ncbi:MAG: hypothetical protein EOP50_17070, partial [Sphingobacteriales bacterium]
MNKCFTTPVFFLLLLTCVLSCKRDSNDDASNGAVPDVQPALQLVADNLVAPLSVVEAPDDSRRMFIVDEIGKI